MRHSFCPYQPQKPALSQPPSRTTSSVPTHQASSSQSSRATAVHVQASASGQKGSAASPSSCQSGKLSGKASIAAAQLHGNQPAAAQSAVTAQRSEQQSGVHFDQYVLESSATSTASDEVTDLPSQAGVEDPAASSTTTAGWHPHDPEHLIVNGLGGAFLHPTHVFTPSRFISVPDPSADEATVTNTRPTANTALRGRSPPRGSSPRGSSPARRGSPRGSSPASTFAKRISLAAAEQGVITTLPVFYAITHCASQGYAKTCTYICPHLRMVKLNSSDMCVCLTACSSASLCM